MATLQLRVWVKAGLAVSGPSCGPSVPVAPVSGPSAPPAVCEHTRTHTRTHTQVCVQIFTGLAKRREQVSRDPVLPSSLPRSPVIMQVQLLWTNH